jgi:SWI/SNF-related matrix-associated actin-dependent regulator of chromatin subfamily B protein 1
MKLDDQFEWDIENPGASPEQFAEVYVRELGLGGEFRSVHNMFSHPELF